jgi:ABC-type bacteriocin/lantibiotic exporter with double-glycine peptidase domain
MSDTPAAPKSHKGLHFFFGFLTGFFSFIIVTVVALVVLVSAFSPVINKKVEGLLEDYASQSASSTLNINVAIDLKAIRYETDAGTNWFYAIGNATKNNGTGTVYAIELGYNVTDDSLAKLENTSAITATRRRISRTTIP